MKRVSTFIDEDLQRLAMNQSQSIAIPEPGNSKLNDLSNLLQPKTVGSMERSIAAISTKRGDNRSSTWSK